MKKIISLMIILVMVLGLATTSFADSPNSDNLSPQELEEFYGAMLQAASNTQIEKAGTTTIPVEYNGLSGTVTIEEKAAPNEEFLVGTEAQQWFVDIPDGDRVITTTLDADAVLGGELLLKSYYTMMNDGTRIDVTDTYANMSPPVGYTDGGTDSYITEDLSDRFSVTGVYTMLALNEVPMTINSYQQARLIGDSAISLDYWKNVE